MWGYEDDGGVMNHDLGHKKLQNQVFVVFYYLEGRNGSLSHFAGMEAGVGNFSKYTAMQ